MFGRNGFRRLWRPFIGIVIAYAVAAQGLLIVLGGFSALAQAARPRRRSSSAITMPMGQAYRPERRSTRGAVIASSVLPESIMR